MRLVLNIPRPRPRYDEELLRAAIIEGKKVHVVVASSHEDAQRIFDATVAWVNGTPPKGAVPG